MKPFVRQFAIVFCVWTLIALIAGLARLALLHAVGQPAPLWDVFRHPLVEQWIWAALTPLAFLVADRVPLARPRLARAIAVHAASFLLLSVLHCLLADGLDEPLARPPGYEGPLVALRWLRDLYSDLWMYWPLVGIQALLGAHRRQREQQEQTARLQQLMADMRLSLLRAQIQPHFLFNTLHAVSSLLKVDPRAADDMVSDLAEILRASFADAGAQEAPLEQELELVGCYLRIQQRRFADRLAVQWQVQADAAGAMVPALVLQSLVENAVVHGIAPMARPCTLTLAVRREADRLQLRVEDDGAGMAAEPQPGLGLGNTAQRLQQLYGSALHWSIDSAPGRGTCVSLFIPFKTAGDARRADHDDTHPDRGRRAAGAAEPAVAA